jgi:hypothetical protein
MAAWRCWYEYETWYERAFVRLRWWAFWLKWCLFYGVRQKWRWRKWKANFPTPATREEER